MSLDDYSLTGAGGLPAGLFLGEGDPEEVPNPNAEMAWEETAISQPEIDSDASVIAQRIYDGMAARAPGWIARDGALDTWLIEEFSLVTAEIRQEAINVPQAIYQTYGEEVLGIPARHPAPANGVSTWTAIDALGYTIPAGTQVTIARTGSDLIVFEVAVGVEIPPEQTTVEGVQLVAVEDGEAGNHLTGTAEVVDPLMWVQQIDVPQPTFGGDDGQTIEEYLGELILLLRMVALRPVLPWDFSVLAMRLPGVQRSVAMDGYDPASGTWGHERTVTLVVTDDAGEPVPLPTRNAVRDYLQSLREINWIVNVIDPTYETIDVEFECTAFAEQDPDVVLEACKGAIEYALSPMNWRLGTTSPSIAAGEVIPPQNGAPPGRQTVRQWELVSLLDRQRGVDWVDGVQINGAAQDFVFEGPTTLPRPGTITGVVNAQSSEAYGRS